MAESSQPAAKTVLVLYGERGDLPAVRAIAENLREVFHNSTSPRIEVLSEYCDFARFPLEQHGANLAKYLQERYRGRQIELVMPVAGFALEFVLQHRSELFSKTPIVFCANDPRDIERVQLPPDATGIVAQFDFEGTFALLQQLQPDATEILIVHGQAGFDLRWAEEARKIVEESPWLRSRARWFGNGTLEQAVEESRRLSPQAAVIFLSMLEDSGGRTMSSVDVVRDLARESTSPVYGLSSQFLPVGILGGALYDFGANGRQTAELALRVLREEWVPYNPGRTRPHNPIMVNWAAMKKWGVDGSRLPPGASIHFRQPTFWQTYRATAIGIVVVVAVQATLIAGLLVNRSTRRRAELALAESEERMSLAADAAHLGMWAWDISANEGWMTEKGRALFGFQPETRLDYAALIDRIHPDDREARDSAVKRALETHGEYEMDYRVQPPNGELRWISARGRWIGGVNGYGPKLLGVSMDVTARKQAELEAAQQRVELGHLSRVALVGEMATSLAHELNQPLTAIVSNAGAAQRFLARGEMNPGELQELLADISADGRRAGDVIRGIKSMVRKVEGERRNLDLNAVVEDVLRLVRADALAHACALTTDLHSALPSVYGDAVQIQQVLLNLIINAFDALSKAPSNFCRVEISSRRLEGHVEISVRDFGPGLRPEDITRVFERFFSTKREGMGMGLAIVRSIIEAHSGTLGAENAEGGGARFWFRLPTHSPTPAEAIA